MNDEYIKVYTGTSSIIVNRLSTLLNDEEIATIIKDNVSSGASAGFGPLGNSIDLFIKAIDKEKANSIINDFEEKIAD